MKHDDEKRRCVFVVASFGPPGRYAKIFEAPVDGGIVWAARISDGRICARLIKRRISLSEIVWSVLSRPISAPAPAMALLEISWNAGVMEIAINSQTVASSSWVSAPIEPMVLRPSQTQGAMEDFSIQNVAAHADRREQLKRQKKWPDRKYPGADFDFDRLEKELAALNDLLRLMNSGAAYHDLSVAKALRTLLIPIRGQMGLLQRCAAHIDAPLIVYTERKPSSRLSDKVEFQLACAIEGSPSTPYPNPVDIDVWLRLPVGFLGEKECSNLMLLKAIGDTRAAHADPGLDPIVEDLERVRYDVEQIPSDCSALASTMFQMGQAIAQASRALLEVRQVVSR